MTKPRPILGWPAALTLVVLIGAVTGSFIVWDMTRAPARLVERSAGATERVVDAGARAARRLAETLTEIGMTTPRILHEDSVIIERGRGVNQLIVLRHPVEVRREMTHRFLHSTKRFRVEGEFLVLAGFDLDKPFSVRAEGESVDVLVPEPEILGVEVVAIDIREMRDGLWNKLTEEEVERAMNALPDLARRKVDDMAVLNDAVTTLEATLRDRLGEDWSVRVRSGAEDRPDVPSESSAAPDPG